MLDFAGANAVRQRAKRAVGRRVRVTAHHRHAGQRCAIFRTHDVDNALAFGQEGEKRRRAKLLDIGVQCGDLLFADQVRDTVVAQIPAGRGRVVVSRGNN